MADGLPLSEAALRRRRRQRWPAVACVVARAGCGGTGLMLAGSAGGMPATPGSTTRHAEQLASGGCGAGGGYADVRGHVVAALQCLAVALELHGYDEVQEDFGKDASE